MNSKIKILMVEHDPADIELIEYELKKSSLHYLTEIVKTEHAYSHALKTFVPDIILSDYSLPSFNGATSFKLRQELAPDTPFIFVSGTIGEENSIEYIRNGVTDYVLKDKLFTLIVKIERALNESNERKLNREAEQQKEFDRNNLNALLNNTHDLMWSVDRNFNLITSNEPFDVIMLQSNGKLVSRGSSVLVTGFSAGQTNRFKQYYERAFRGEVFSEIEFISKPEEIWSKVSFYPIWFENEIIGTACQSTNISEIKKTQRQLEKSESFNKGILNSLSSQIAVIDGSGKIVAVNESWKKFACEYGDTILNVTGIGVNYFDVCERASKNGDTMAAFVLAGIKNVMNENNVVFYFEYPCHFKEQQRWFSIRVMKFDSTETMVVAAHEDISERKLVEEKLISNNRELNKTNSELDRFVYSASHDLRAPLCSILGLISLIETERSPSTTMNYVAMIRNSVSRLDGFIRNILSYSKNNRVEPENRQIPVVKTIQNIIDSLRHMKEAAGISFKIDIDEPAIFYSDAHRFTIVLENLISNAIKFQNYERPDRFIKISGRSNHDKLDLRISDNGIGIADIYQPKIFDMFFRIHGEREGSGIGLYVVKETIEKLHGSISVESVEGKGTTFAIQFINTRLQESSAESKTSFLEKLELPIPV